MRVVHQVQYESNRLSARNLMILQIRDNRRRISSYIADIRI